MFAMVNIVSVNHALEVTAAICRSPLDSLVNDDVVEYEVEQPIKKDSQPHRKHIRIVIHQRKIIEDANGRDGKHDGEKVVALKLVVMHGVVRFMPGPE